MGNKGGLGLLIKRVKYGYKQVLLLSCYKCIMGGLTFQVKVSFWASNGKLTRLLTQKWSGQWCIFLEGNETEA